MNLPKSVFIPNKVKSLEKMEIKFEEFDLHWSTEKGTYKKNSQNTDISLSKVNFLNDLRHLYNIIMPLTNFAASKKYLDFWNSKLIPRQTTKDEINWLTFKIFSSINSFINNSLNLAYSVCLILKQIIIEENVLDIHHFKKNLIIDAYSIIESFLVSINSIYLFLSKSGIDLVNYEQKLNKLEITIDKVNNIKYSEFLKVTKDQSLKNDFENLFKVRNIIVHPFSVREDKKDKNYSYWQILYVGNAENKLDYNEVFIVKMAKSNVKDNNWIDIPNQKYKSPEKVEILNLSIKLLEGIWKYIESK